MYKLQKYKVSLVKYYLKYIMKFLYCIFIVALRLFLLNIACGLDLKQDWRIFNLFFTGFRHNLELQITLICKNEKHI